MEPESIFSFSAILKMYISLTDLYFVKTSYNFWSTNNINLKLAPMMDIKLSYKLE